MSFEESKQAGLAAARQKEWEAAVEHLAAAHELNEDDLETMFYLGACHGQLKQFVEAEHYLSMVCEVAPQMPQAHFNLGQTFQARGQLEMAIRSYENALRAKRDYAPARAALEAMHATLSPDLRDDEEEATADDDGQPEAEEPEGRTRGREHHAR